MTSPRVRKLAGIGVSGGEIGGQFRGEKGATNSAQKGTGSKLGTGIHGQARAGHDGSSALGTSTRKWPRFLTATDRIGVEFERWHRRLGFGMFCFGVFPVCVQEPHALLRFHLPLIEPPRADFP